MGSNLCCFRWKKEQKNEKLQPPVSKTSSERSLTLEECILASPNSNTQCITTCELHVFQQLSRKVHPSTRKVPRNFSTPRTSFSTERLWKIDEGDEEDDYSSVSVSSMSESKSGKFKKKVSFKLPEESDVIVFYTPKEAFEEY